MNEEEFELLRQSMGLASLAGIPDSTRKLLEGLAGRKQEILTAFPGLGPGMVGHLMTLLGEAKKALTDCERREAEAAIKAKTECGCDPQPTEELETQLKCLLRPVLREATATNGAEGVCAVNEMLTQAQRISAQRKFLYGLYDLYVNAALASGLPNDQLPSAVRGGRGGQEGDNGGGRPSAP
jgi:hypothetical protein